MDYCPQILWDLLYACKDAPQSWLSSCSSSFAWFVHFYPVAGAPLDRSDLPAWLSYISLDSCWKGRLRRAAEGCLAFRQATAEQRVWTKGFQASFEAAGGVLPVSQSAPRDTWICDHCGQAFSSRKALATHSGRMHGYRRLVKFFAVDDVCNCLFQAFSHSQAPY